jgi:hypothetical protein
MNRLSIAQVGHVDAHDDRARWLTIRRWLRANDRPFFDLLRGQEERGELDHHFIDLNHDPPRDFLTEQYAHDVVITHNLWGEVNEGYTIRTGGAAQSVHHRADSWQRRFRETGARYLFLAGNAFTLEDLGGSLPGYEEIDLLSPWYMTILLKVPGGKKTQGCVPSAPKPQ